jgi:hypothetical protein
VGEDNRSSVDGEMAVCCDEELEEAPGCDDEDEAAADDDDDDDDDDVEAGGKAGRATFGAGPGGPTLIFVSLSLSLSLGLILIGLSSSPPPPPLSATIICRANVLDEGVYSPPSLSSSSFADGMLEMSASPHCEVDARSMFVSDSRGGSALNRFDRLFSFRVGVLVTEEDAEDEPAAPAVDAPP